MSDLILKAVKSKLRFKTSNGVLNTEDLFDLSLSDLDILYQHYNREIKSSEGESLLGKKNKATKVTELRKDVVKLIFETLQSEAANKASLLDKKVKRDKLLTLLASKQESAMNDKSIDELKSELDELDKEDSIED